MSAKFLVKPSKLKGSVKVSGAKNSVLRLLAASLLFDEDVILENYPQELLDVKIHEGMLEKLGKKIHHISDDEVKISNSKNGINTTLIWDDRSIRNTLLILGSLVSKYGIGKVPLPGGCKLGERKYDIHVNVLESLGAKVYEEEGYLVAESKNKRLIGTDIHLRMRSTGATENAILASVLAEGNTRIYNPHIRPEIIDLIDFLNKSGANITVFGQERIDIQGVSRLSHIKHIVMPDNMEALTWLVIGAVTKSQIEIIDFPFKDLEVPLIHLRESGVKLFKCENVAIVGESDCYPLEVSTGPYPGINSDMQPILAAFSAFSQGNSDIVDLRFPGRYAYSQEMQKMGVSSEVNGDLLRIFGNNTIIGAHVRALDLRAGIALLILALAAQSGQTQIDDAWQIKRGYNKLLEKLSALGADIKEV